MSDKKYNIDEFSNLTGLTVKKVRKWYAKYQDIFERLMERGDNNKLLFDGNFVAIFNAIKRWREEDIGYKAIGEKLKELEVIRENRENTEANQEVKEGATSQQSTGKDRVGDSQLNLVINLKDETIQNIKSQLSKLENEKRNIESELKKSSEENKELLSKNLRVIVESGVWAI